MKIVIDIPEDDYKAICDNGYIFDEDSEGIAKAIKNGTPVSTEGDLISREALKLTIENFQIFNPKLSVYDVLKIIDNAPTVERPQGEWNKCFDKKDYFIGWKCSRCEKICKGIYNYCPNCGADMREEKE